jgi:diaminohydroxyphosphoribosylaminopyrimidine deaminase/5-amino-6-(5-phosphoribosylamino)uracil reductase
MVGAVLAKRGQIIAKSWHTGPGRPHAEAGVLNEAGRKAKGAELYVNLEPCAHYGRTGPCVEAIIKAGVAKVYYSVPDPNPEAAGGAAALESAGVEVDQGLMAEQAWELNQFFFKWVTTRLPFVVLKTAASLDGKIATTTGDSRWISSKSARNFVHDIRAGVDAIIVGRNTAFKDDPELSARPWGRRKMHNQPWRVVLDPFLRLSRTLKIFNSELGGPTVICCAREAEQSSKEAVRRLGHDVWEINRLESGLLSLREVIAKLGSAGVQSALMECGATLASSALIEEPVADLVHIFLAPKFIGGREAPTMIGGPGLPKLDAIKDLELVKIGRKGPDIHLVVRPEGAFRPGLTLAPLEGPAKGLGDDVGEG